MIAHVYIYDIYIIPPFYMLLFTSTFLLTSSIAHLDKHFRRHHHHNQSSNISYQPQVIINLHDLGISLICSTCYKFNNL